MNAENILPTLFISHGGGPWPLMKGAFGPADMWDGLEKYLRGLSDGLGSVPKAVLVISGHWEEKEFTVNTGERPPLYYDYSGFPEETYRIKYPAPGSPLLASRVRSLLETSGFPVGLNAERGYDHGVFVPFMLIYPKADIPLVQLSIKKSFDPAEHIRLGQALQPLRREGILIVGSGNSFHNLRFSPDILEPSRVFDAWLTEAVTDPDPISRNRKLGEWQNAPHARAAQPREDHLVPLFVAAGAAGKDTGRKVFSDTLFGFPNSGYQFG